MEYVIRKQVFFLYKTGGSSNIFSPVIYIVYFDQVSGANLKAGRNTQQIEIALLGSLSRIFNQEETYNDKIVILNI